MNVVNFIKLIAFVWLTIVGLFTTFGVVWMQCGLILTKDAVTLLAVLSVVVGVPYIFWMVKVI